MTYIDPAYLLRGRKIKKLAEQSCEDFRHQYGLKQIDIDVLAYLYKHPGITACEIADVLDLHKGQLSEALKHLAEKGYINEYHDSKDHRYMHYQPTQKGDPLVKSIMETRTSVKKKMFAGFSDEEKQELDRLMKKIAVNVEDAIKEYQ